MDENHRTALKRQIAVTDLGLLRDLLGNRSKIRDVSG